MDIKKLASIHESGKEPSGQLLGRDDLYNLSVRRRAESLALSIMDKLGTLDTVYAACGDEYAERCRVENCQIAIIINSILRAIRTRAQNDAPEKCRAQSDSPRVPPSIGHLLLGSLEDIAALADVISLRRIERELLLCSRALLAQLRCALAAVSE